MAGEIREGQTSIYQDFTKNACSPLDSTHFLYSIEHQSFKLLRKLSTAAHSDHIGESLIELISLSKLLERQVHTVAPVVT